VIHLPQLIQDLAIILITAATVTLIFKKLGQPVVLGYLIAGFLLSPHVPLVPTIKDLGSVKVWAEIGVIFLLFGLGLEFSLKKLAQVGRAASITAFFEVAFMLSLGFATGQALGWSQIDSLFLGGILSISSTTIIVRAFDELGLKGHRFVSLVFGVLLVEDIVAILLLVLLSTVALSQTFSGGELMSSGLKLGFFLVLWFSLGVYLLPLLLHRIRVLMNDEIFGPVLPVISFTTKEEAMQIIRRHPNPLAFYVFTSSGTRENDWLNSVAFGGGCVNNASWHLTNHHLPFGGRGFSGSGNYHGKYSFETFSHKKAVMKTPTWFDPAMKYPPLKGKLKFFKWIIR